MLKEHDVYELINDALKSLPEDFDSDRFEMMDLFDADTQAYFRRNKLSVQLGKVFSKLVANQSWPNIHYTKRDSSNHRIYRQC